MASSKDRSVFEATLESGELVADIFTRGEVLAGIPLIGNSADISPLQYQRGTETKGVIVQIDSDYLAQLKSTDNPCEVIQDFLDDFGIDDLEILDRFCEMGGAPDEEGDVQFSVQNAIRKGSQYVVAVEAFFDEKVYGGGCADMPTIRPRNGDLMMIIDIKSGEVEFPVDHSK